MTDSSEAIYDVIVVGAGVAGTRLVAHLLSGPWRDRRILVIERAPQSGRDHVLAFWSRDSGALEALAEHAWSALRVAGDAEALRPLRDYRYLALTRVALLRATARTIEACPNVQVLAGEVDAIEDGPDAALVRVGERSLRARWVFDSRRPAPGPATMRLEQRFVGWTIEAPALRLDPSAATLFDLRTEQRDGACFVYVLPFAPERALVEHVFTGPPGAAGPDAELALRTYLRDQLGLAADRYTLTARERGASLLSDARHPRRAGRRVCTIGVRGGRLKPSSGYALTRIERDSAAIARSLARHGHPFRLPRERLLYRVLDAIFLWALARDPARAPEIFAALMRRPERTLRFLDEQAGALDLLALIVVLPTWVFLRAALRWLLARRRAAEPPAAP